MTNVRLFDNAASLGQALAREIADGIEVARAERRRFVLGCPGGRSGRSTYVAVAELLRGQDLGHLVIAMMDDYVMRGADGGWQHVPADAHYSCRRFAVDEIVVPMATSAAVGVAPEHVWLPDPSDPDSYAERLQAAGGVDHFIVASGASDGHVAFVKPGTNLDSGMAIVPLAESTRRDNMSTFPQFESIDQVPTHGVSVGLGTIRSLSRRVTLVLHGRDKRTAAQRVLATRTFDPAWPATFIHRCRGGEIWLDMAANPNRPET